MMIYIFPLTAAPCSNLVASGSSDGHIRFWKCGDGFKHLTRLKFTVQVPGFVNSLQFSEDGSMLVAGVGQEHRLGRWWTITEAKNTIWIVHFRQKNVAKENGVQPTMTNGVKEHGDSEESEEEGEEEDEEGNDRDIYGARLSDCF